jgi:predicted ATPase
MIRRQVAMHGVSCPTFDFAIARILAAQGRLSKSTLLEAVASDVGFGAALVDVVSKTTWGTVASELLRIFETHQPDSLRLRWLARAIDLAALQRRFPDTLEADLGRGSHRR